MTFTFFDGLYQQGNVFYFGLDGVSNFTAAFQLAAQPIVRKVTVVAYH